MANLGAQLTLQIFRRHMATEAHGHKAGGDRTWKILTFFVALPVVGVSMLNAWLREQNHPQKSPEFRAYDHLRIRTKKFPWGDGNHTLFHNPHTNPLPSGYEETDHKH
ncbi:hypothetical protein GDO78_017847 [Eleutherodactylus coqui]|uniref:Cytochrome c oxidase subunit n=1 Tax=Eleutherodactylus coqui TaxID=57060 RepID=A0A8J6BIJ7_ELECQ|nr:hypothetical protein GDO78_017847 [Eleutherodactylus coqui]